MNTSDHLMKTPFAIPNQDGLTIRGYELVLDDGKLHEEAVIVCHGFKANMKRSEPYAIHLASLGLRAYYFDFNGGSWDSSSDGSFEDYMTPLTEVGDLECVMAMVKEKDHPKALLLEGHSQGGFVCSYTAAKHPEEVSALILYYPAMCIPDDARRGQMQILKFDPNNIPDHIGTSPLRVSGNYPRSVLHLDIFKEIIGYKGPVCLIHGDADPIVNYSYAIKTFETYKANGNFIEFKTIHGGGHGFEGAYQQEAMAFVESFLKQIHLLPTQS